MRAKALSLLQHTASLQNSCVDALSNTFNYILSHDLRARKLKHNSYMMRCVAHNDKHTSLSVKLKDDRILLHCFASCSLDEILSALRLEKSDLFAKQSFSTEAQERKRLRAEIRKLDDEVSTKAKELYNKLAYLHRRYLALAQDKKQQDNAFFALAAKQINIAHFEYLLDCLMSRNKEDKQYALNSKFAKELIKLCR